MSPTAVSNECNLCSNWATLAVCCSFICSGLNNNSYDVAELPPDFALGASFPLEAVVFDKSIWASSFLRRINRTILSGVIYILTNLNSAPCGSARLATSSDPSCSSRRSSVVCCIRFCTRTAEGTELLSSFADPYWVNAGILTRNLRIKK